MNELFQMRLLVTNAGSELPRDDTPLLEVDDNNDIAVPMSAICRWLEQHGGVQFEVSGFGQALWPVDVDVDLAIVAEQIPRVLEGLLNRTPIVLDFYEQGLARAISFEFAERDEVNVLCRSGTTWTPSPEEYQIPRRVVIEMLAKFGHAFAGMASERCPGPTSHIAYQTWLGQLKRVLARAQTTATK